LVDKLSKSSAVLGFGLFIFGVVLGLYASQRNCLIAFVARGYMSFWTVVEILAGLLALAGIIIALIGFIK